MTKKDNLSLIIMFTLIIILIPVLIIMGEYKKLIVVLLSSFITFGLFYLIGLFCYDYNREFKKTRKYYDSIENKKNKNIFEEFYILTFQNKAVSLLREKLNIKKVNNISHLGINTKKTNHINISYDYENYSVNILLSNNKIIYYLDTPYEYDYLDDTKEFEKKNIIDININNIKNLDEYLDLIIDLINNLKNDIKTFTKDHEYNNELNGNIIRKYKYSIDYIKIEGFVNLICCSFIFIVFLYISIVEFNTTIDGIISSILSLLVSISCFIPTIYGIKQLLKIVSINSDINKVKISVINEKPRKIKIIRNNIMRYSHNDIVYIKIYYKRVTLYALVKKEIFIKNPENLKEAYLECLKINQKIKYLSKSKIIISGGERYISIIENHIH